MPSTTHVLPKFLGIFQEAQISFEPKVLTGPNKVKYGFESSCSAPHHEKFISKSPTHHKKAFPPHQSDQQQIMIQQVFFPSLSIFGYFKTNLQQILDKIALFAQKKN